MAQELSIEFSRLLDQYDEKRRVVEERKRQVKADEEAFREGFTGLRARVVRPVFEALGAILKERGHGFDISEDEHASGPDGKTTEAAIAIRLMPVGLEKSPQGDAQFPSLAFVTRLYSKTVSIRGSNSLPQTSGPGSRKDYRLAEIDRELVQAELLKLISGMVNR